MATDEEAFRAQIRNNPSDDTLRLVYADWLDERSDPLGSVLRAEVVARNVLPLSDVHGVLEAEEYIGVTPAQESLTGFAALPWDEQVLKACAGNHLLIAGRRLSILELQDLHPNLFSSANGVWLAAEPFARDKRVQSRWYLFRKEPVPGSVRKAYYRQRKVLAEGEDVPLACEVVYALLLHRLVTGHWLPLNDLYLASRDTTSFGNRVTVACDETRGLFIGTWESSRVAADTGLASRRV